MNLMPNGPALHEDDGMVTVFSGDGCRQTDDIAGLRSARDKLKTRRGQVVAFIDDQLAVVSHDVVDYAVSDQALDKRHVNHACRFPPSTANCADLLGVDLKEGLQPLNPLVEKFTTMHQNQRVSGAMSNQGRRDDGFAEGCGRGKHASIMRDERLEGAPLRRPKLTKELNRARQRGSIAALVVQFCLRTVFGQDFNRLIKAASRQGNVAWVQLGKGDHARLSEGGQPHRLRPIELGVLESCDPYQLGNHRRGQPGSVNVDLICDCYLDVWKNHHVRRLCLRASRRRHFPGLVSVFIINRHPDGEHLTRCLSSRNKIGYRLRGHPWQRRQIRPLVFVWLKILIEEDAIADPPGTVLERQRDQVSKAASGHRILVRKEAVIGRKSDLWPFLHGFRDQCRSKLASRPSRHRFGEEYPDMAPIARSGPFQCSRHTLRLTSCK
ncbi:hypothetical protein C8N33_1247 [Pararhodobacter aggregans]|nr:hypothetical protein C8N33_1247 [Pararhodobacter aggregans]